MKFERAALRSTGTTTSNALDSIQSKCEHAAVVHVRGRDDHGEGHATAVNDEVTLAAMLARPVSCPSQRKATVAESRLERVKSSWPCVCRRSRSRRCKLAYTPACCHSRRRRQHVMPLPHPRARGRWCQATAGLEHKTYPGEDRAVGNAWSASPGSGMCWQDGFDSRPKVIGDSGNAHPGRLRAAHYCSAL